MNMNNDSMMDREKILIDLLVGKNIQQSSVKMMSFVHKEDTHMVIITSHDRETHESLGTNFWNSPPFGGATFECQQPPIRYFGCISKVPKWYALTSADEKYLKDKFGIVNKKRKRFEENNTWASEIRVEFNDIQKLYNAIKYGIWLGNSNYPVQGWVFGPKACYKCLDQSHYTEECSLLQNEYLCFKCADTHHTRDHVVKAKGNTAYKCIVCNGNHPAFSDTCVKLANMIITSNSFQIKLFKYLKLINTAVDYINTRSNLFKKEEIYLESLKVNIRDISTKETIQQYGSVLGGSMKEELMYYIDRKFDDIKNDFIFKKEIIENDINSLRSAQERIQYEHDQQIRNIDRKAEVRHTELLNAIRSNITDMERAKSYNNLNILPNTNFQMNRQLNPWQYTSSMQQQHHMNFPISNSTSNIYMNNNNHKSLNNNSHQINYDKNGLNTNSLDNVRSDITEMDYYDNELHAGVPNQNINRNVDQNNIATNTNTLLNTQHQLHAVNTQQINPSIPRSNSANFIENNRRYRNSMYNISSHQTLNSTIESEMSSFFYGNQ